MQDHGFLLAVRHQAHPLVLPARPEQLHRGGDRHRRLGDRQVGRDHLAHPCVDRGEFRLRERLASLDLAVVPAHRGGRVLDAHLDAGKHLRGCRHQEEGQGTPVDPDAVPLRRRDRDNLGILGQRRRQFPEPSLDHHGHDRRAVFGRRRALDGQFARRERLLHPEDVADEGADRGLEHAAVGEGREDVGARQRGADPDVERRRVHRST
jgi:hypothetical protein